MGLDPKGHRKSLEGRGRRHAHNRAKPTRAPPPPSVRPARHGSTSSGRVSSSFSEGSSFLVRCSCIRSATSARVRSLYLGRRFTIYQMANIVGTNANVAPTVTPTVTSTVVGSSASTHIPHGEKTEKFNGVDFKRWQQKMLFYLTTLNLARFLTEDPPSVQQGENNRASVIALDTWKHSDFLCKNYVLNGLNDSLYGVYSIMKSAKELWDSLEKKYKTEDAGTKKFLVGKFLDYKMIDSKYVISQVQDLQVLLHDLHAERLTVSESFQVTAVIEKLPPLWRDFKNYLKHKRKEMNLEELIVRLRIEEDTKKFERRNGGPSMGKHS
ncbi:zinc knuckle (CCHC-type) family protein [Abeliophyllum distichum]|uniref:Zinc knuckle (CCHC-type) family protein n=1 Tax=Abeliophyllum distichum TaxID=126358 RepID=A0ABD1PPM2_9LAMI